MKPHGITEEQIQLSAFSFSLKNAAKDLLYYLPPGSITTWTEMKRIFQEKYFPDSRAANIRKEIYGIKQYTGESLHEYWERSMVDAVSEGVFVDKTPREARNLIENMAANSQQFATNRSDHAPKKNNEEMDKLRRHVEFALQWDMQLTCVPHYKRSRSNRPLYPPQQQNPQIPEPGEFLENIVKDIATNTLNFQQETRASIQNLNTHMGQLATAINKLEEQHSNTFPSQTIPNLRENASAITLRNGKELKVKEKGEAQKGKFPPVSEYKPVAPFPLALKESRKDEGIKEFYDTFRICEVNIPLLDVIKQEPFIKLKKFPKHLKYVFLGEGETLPVIISSSLEVEQEEQLIKALKEHKTAIGWTIVDIKGISPSTCMHRILMEERASPLRQPRKKLNPPMMEVVKADVLKLLEVGVIYPISDSHYQE
ncbi:uncharacterized protein [Henckelia pumila]|uniref:uncharacterized protein n=1 Tax=Henckelia pumila TaxID=405737 RepID=UPI003C6E58B5